jgi:hypothetical protein
VETVLSFSPSNWSGTFEFFSLLYYVKLFEFDLSYEIKQVHAHTCMYTVCMSMIIC